MSTLIFCYILLLLLCYFAGLSRLAHVTHQSPAVTCQLNNDTHDSPAVTCQLDTDTCDSPADSPLSIQQIAQLLVDEVLKKSVALVSATALASSVTEDVVVTEIYFSDSSSEKRCFL